MSLPLTVSAVEHYMLSDDHRDYPMCFAFRLEFSGAVHREHFEAAVRSSLQRHPLLAAKMQDRDGQLEWTPTELPNEIVRWESAAAGLRPMDLTEEIGTQVFVTADENTTHATFQIHHACCDGIGASQFIEDTLLAYHNAVDSQPVAQRELRLDALHARGDISQQNSLFSFPRRLAIGIARAVHFFRNEPLRIYGYNAGEQPGPDCSCSRLQPGSLENLRSALNGSGTINDHLLSFAFETLFDWQKEVLNGEAKTDGTPPPVELNGQCLRMGVPVNLRSKQHRSLPAANVVTVTYLDRNQHDVEDHSRLVSGIHEQMEGIKQRKSGTFVRIMQFMNRKRMRRLVSADRVYFSATFSNLGEIWGMSDLPRTDHGYVRVGNLTLENINVQAPVRKTMPVFLVVFSYAGELHFSISYDRAVFSADDAQRLHARFHQRIWDWMKDVASE